jgi:hypothetical protein
MHNGLYGSRHWGVLPMLITLTWGTGWQDPRLLGYRTGLSIKPVHRLEGGLGLGLYNPRASLERLSQLRLLISSSAAVGTRYLLWGGYRYLALTRALLWGQGSAPANVAFIWVGGRPPRHLPYRRQAALWLTTTPTLETMPYSGLGAQAALWALWDTLTGAV